MIFSDVGYFHATLFCCYCMVCTARCTEGKCQFYSMVVGKEIQVRIVYTIWNCPKYIFMLSFYWVRQLLVACTLFSECLWVCVGKNLTISSSVSWLCNFYLSCQRHAICSFPWECLSLAVGNWAGNFNYEKMFW